MSKPKSQVNIPKRSASKNQSRPSRILWAMPFCLLDTSSGANMSIRAILRQLVQRGYEVTILGATVFDDPKGANSFRNLLEQLRYHTGKVVSVKDENLAHHLFVTHNTYRVKMSQEEESNWHVAYLQLLDSFKPDLVGFYGGHVLEMMISHEARIRGVPSLFYLANGNYRAKRWCQDVDLILTDTQETSEFYQEKIGFNPVPVGKFIETENFVASEHDRARLLFVNPSLAKGAGIVIQLALSLETRRPDLKIEVVESRGDWNQLVQKITADLGNPRKSLPNVILSPNTRDMRPIYGRARVLLAPSLWWESGARVLAESMLNGIPALVSNYGGSPGMIEDGGLVIDLPEECHTKPYYHLVDNEKIEEIVQKVLALFDDESLYQSYVSCAERVGREKHHIDVSTDRLIKVIKPLLKRREGNRISRNMVEKHHKHGLTWGVSTNGTYWPDGFAEATIDLADLEAPEDNSSVSESQELGKDKTEVYSDNQFQAEVDVADVKGADAIKNKKQAEINWQLESPIIVVDNRAKLLKTGAADELVKTNALNIIAFDPASEVAYYLDQNKLDDIQIFQHALLGDGNQTSLNVCLDGTWTSVLSPLQQESLSGQYRKGAEVIAELPINTVALDSIDGLPSVDWLILDDLSDTMTILENGEKVLKETLMIQVRVAFQPTHESQVTFSSLNSWAEANGFRFYRFNDMQYQNLLGDVKHEASGENGTDLQSLDVLFLPKDNRLERITGQQLYKLVFLLQVVFGAHDAAGRIQSQFLSQDDEQNTTEKDQAKQDSYKGVHRASEYRSNVLVSGKRVL